MAKSLNLTLKVWRQESASASGNIETIDAKDIPESASFLEMLDIVNERLVAEGSEPVAFDITIVSAPPTIPGVLHDSLVVPVTIIFFVLTINIRGPPIPTQDNPKLITLLYEPVGFRIKFIHLKSILPFRQDGQPHPFHCPTRSSKCNLFAPPTSSSQRSSSQHPPPNILLPTFLCQHSFADIPLPASSLSRSYRSGSLIV